MTCGARVRSSRAAETRPGPGRGSPTSTSSPASDSALGDSTSNYYPGVQADYNQNIVADPKNRRHLYLQLEEVFESTDGGASWQTVGPYWNYDISCEQAHGDPYACPPTTHPDQHAGMIYRGPVLGRQRRRGLAPSPQPAHPRALDRPQRRPAHAAELLGRGRAGRERRPRTGAGCRTTASRTPGPTWTGWSRRSPGTAATPSWTRRHGDSAVVEYINLDMWSTIERRPGTRRRSRRPA